MSERYFYQVQADYVFIPKDMKVYMTLSQMRARGGIVPDEPHPSQEGWYPVTQHSHNYTDLVFDRGQVFGLSQIPEPVLLAKLTPWQPPAETPLKPELQKMTLYTFTQLTHQPEKVFTALTGLTRAEFTQRLTCLSSLPRRGGRPIRFERQDALYLGCLHRQGLYTYAQLASCYQWSITQVYAAVQWVNKRI